jgi:hypothetical protein
MQRARSHPIYQSAGSHGAAAAVSYFAQLAPELFTSVTHFREMLAGRQVFEKAAE